MRWGMVAVAAAAPGLGDGWGRFRARRVGFAERWRAVSRPGWLGLVCGFGRSGAVGRGLRLRPGLGWLGAVAFVAGDGPGRGCGLGLV